MKSDTRKREGGVESWVLMKAIKRKAVRETERRRETIMKQLADRAVNPTRRRNCCMRVVTADILPVTHSTDQQVRAAS